MGLEEYDVPEYTPLQWNKECTSENLVCVRKNGAVIGAYHFVEDGGLIIILPEYRRMKLGESLYDWIFAQKRWIGEETRMHTWIRPDYIPSIHLLHAVSAAYPTGKMKYRYI